MMIHKLNSSVDYNKWLKRLKTQLNEQSNQKSPKQLNQRIRKPYHETLGTRSEQ